MGDQQGVPQGEPATEPQGTGTTPPAEPQGAPTPPPETPGTDWKSEARKWEQRAKKDAETLERLREALTGKEKEVNEEVARAQAQARDAELSALRYKIAYEHGLPPDLAARLTGENEEQIREDAKALASYVRKTPPTGAKQGSNAGTPAPAKQDPNELLRAIVRG